MTMKALMSPAELDKVAELGSKQAVFFPRVGVDSDEAISKLGIIGINMHDPAAMLYAADQSIFKAYPAGIRVETVAGGGIEPGGLGVQRTAGHLEDVHHAHDRLLTGPGWPAACR